MVRMDANGEWDQKLSFTLNHTVPAVAGASGIPRLLQLHEEMRKLELRKLLFLEGPFHRALFLSSLSELGHPTQGSW